VGTVSKCHKTTSAHSCMQEVEVAGTTLKCHKDPPPARFCMRGRWGQGWCRNRKGPSGPWPWPGAGITMCGACISGCLRVSTRWSSAGSGEGRNLLTHLVRLRQHGSLLLFTTCPQPVRLKSIDIEIGWPTSLTGGERPGGNEFGSGGT